MMAIQRYPGEHDIRSGRKDLNDLSAFLAVAYKIKSRKTSLQQSIPREKKKKKKESLLDGKCAKCQHVAKITWPAVQRPELYLRFRVYNYISFYFVRCSLEFQGTCTKKNCVLSLIPFFSKAHRISF